LFLQEKFSKYGPWHVKSTQITLEIPGKSETAPVYVTMSPYHYQIDPTIHSIYDRTLIQAFIAEVVRYKIVSGFPFRIIVIENADMLTVKAQESLRRTLETYIGACRFIFLCNREDKIIEPLYSRCVTVKCSAPTNEEVFQIIRKIAPDISEEPLREISSSCERDLNMAMKYVEQFSLRWHDEGVRKFSRDDYDSIQRTCAGIVDMIIRGSDMDETITAVREEIYDLMTFCVNCQSLISRILSISIGRLPKSETDAIYDLCQVASQSDSTIRMSSKPVYHVEHFCLHLYRIVKSVMDKRKQERVRVKIQAKTAP
jgi:replication factor C subunit 3/5